MTADHPTREERHENLIEFVRTFETGEQAANALPIFLRAADPAPAQPDAGLSDDERGELKMAVSTGCGCAPDGLCRSCKIPFAAVGRTVDHILAARAAQPSQDPSAAERCVICHSTGTRHDGLCCAHRYDEQPPCDHCPQGDPMNTNHQPQSDRDDTRPSLRPYDLPASDAEIIDRIRSLCVAWEQENTHSSRQYAGMVRTALGDDR